MFLDDHLTASGTPRHRRGRRRGPRPRHWNTLLRFEPLEQRTVLAAVLATVPSQGGPQVDPATDVSVYFNDPMDPATLTPDNITAGGSDSGQHTAQLSYTPADFELHIDPATEFALPAGSLTGLAPLTAAATARSWDRPSSPSARGLRPLPWSTSTAMRWRT